MQDEAKENIPEGNRVGLIDLSDPHEERSIDELVAAFHEVMGDKLRLEVGFNSTFVGYQLPEGMAIDERAAERVVRVHAQQITEALYLLLRKRTGLSDLHVDLLMRAYPEGKGLTDDDPREWIGAPMTDQMRAAARRTGRAKKRRHAVN